MGVPTDVDEERKMLKANLRGLLSKHKGCTKHEEVVEAIKELSKTKSEGKASESEWWVGDFLATSAPGFPGRLKPPDGEDSDVVQYTLGRLSFNIFQPNDLICTVKAIRNHVFPKPQVEENGKVLFSYNVTVDIIIHTPNGDLDACLKNMGVCEQSEDKDDRMFVTFTGGSLMPGQKAMNDPAILDLWNKTFADAYKIAEEKRTWFGWIVQYMMKGFLGLTLPSDSTDPQDKSFHFDMTRPYKGFLDLLYHDHDLRITKGNRGTIVIVEPIAQNVIG